jgi:hypothetical protein
VHNGILAVFGKYFRVFPNKPLKIIQNLQVLLPSFSDLWEKKFRKLEIFELGLSLSQKS